MKKLLLIFIPLISGLLVQAQTDLALIEVNPVDYASAGVTKQFYPFCHNMGSTNVDYADMTIHWQINGGAIQTATPQNTTPHFLISGLKKELINPAMTFLPPSTEGTYELKVWISIVGTDINPANDTIRKQVRVINNLPQKNVVLETFKHQACGPCYPGDTMIKNQIDIYPHYHSVNIYTATADVIYSADGDALENGLGPYAHPTVVYDHFRFPGETGFAQGFYTLNGNKYLDNLWKRDEYLEPVEVTFSKLDIDKTNNILTVELSAKFYDNLSDDLRFNLYVLEDSIVGYQASAPNPNTYVHTRVMREILGGIWGQASSIPSTVIKGQTVTYTYNYTVPANFDMRMLRLVGMVQKYNASLYDRRILNSAKVLIRDYWDNPLAVNEIHKNENLKVYPNPATNTLNIFLKNGEEYKIVIKNVLGQTIIESDFESKLDISSLKRGSYFIELSSDENKMVQSFIKK